MTPGTVCAHIAPVAAALAASDVHTDYLLCPDGMWTWTGNGWQLEETMHPPGDLLAQARGRGLDGHAHCPAAKTFHRIDGSGRIVADSPPDREVPLTLTCDRELGHDGNRHHDPATGVDWFG